MKNIGLLTLFILVLCFSNDLPAQNNALLIKFGLIADIQYCDCDAANNRYYRNSLPKLDEAIEYFNKNDVQFTINLGDLSDRNPASLDTIMLRLKRLDKKVYNTTGNHDYNGITDNKYLFKKLKMPSEYYSFKKGKWQFIILNTNEIASYANVEGTYKEGELHEMQSRIKEEKRNNGAPWNGGISKKQMQWLQKELEKAQKKAQNVIVFSHHPLYPEMGLTALNDKEILDLIGKYSCVKALFAGHHHVGAFGYYNNIPSVTVQGIVETENENAYGIVEIYSDKIVLNGKGRMKSYEFQLE